MDKPTHKTQLSLLPAHPNKRVPSEATIVVELHREAQEEDLAQEEAKPQFKRNLKSNAPTVSTLADQDRATSPRNAETGNEMKDQNVKQPIRQP